MRKFTKTVVFTIDEELYGRLLACADSRQRNTSDMIRVMVRKFVADYELENPQKQ